jgi:hypothetical protein
MNITDLTQAVQDSANYVQHAVMQIEDVQQHADIYKWLAAGAGAIIVIFATYVLTSWGSTVKALKDSILKLNASVGTLSEELHMNRADEVAYRGLEEMKHRSHERSFVLINTEIDCVKEDVATVKSDLKELQVEHKMYHSGALHV